MIIYKVIAIIGLISIIIGTFLVSGKRSIRRRYIYPLLIIGGIALEIFFMVGSPVILKG